MTNVNSPSVRMFKGRVSTSKTGLITALTMPSTSAATTAAPNPGTLTPRTTNVVRYNATALISHRKRNPVLRPIL